MTIALISFTNPIAKSFSAYKDKRHKMVSENCRGAMSKKLKLYAFILLRLEKFWTRLCNRNKVGKKVHSFFRRAPVRPKNVKLIFHVTHPIKEIRRAEGFIERITGNSKDLWKTHGHEYSLRSYKEYMGFLQGRKKQSSLDLKTCANFLNPIHQTLYLKLLG